MLLEKDPWNLIITGVGGQGNVLASQILGQLLVNKGYTVTVGETYGASQRGGSVMSHMRVSVRDQFSPLIPEGQADLIMGLEPTEVLRVLAPYGNPGTMVLLNTRPIHPIDVIAGDVRYPALGDLLERIRALSARMWILNATEIALEMGDPIFSNIVMLGALSALEVLPIDLEGFKTVAGQLVSANRVEDNLLAFQRGRAEVKEFPYAG
ncbi:MAG: indolepyruvate oxidoreductase subunit beta [Thermodesulfobacteriota bacterium]